MTDASTEPVRHRLALLLTAPVDTPVPSIGPPAGLRHPAENDVAALGALMWDAYRGTPDERDAGTGAESATEEIRQVFAGEHGPFLPDASYVAYDGVRPVAAALVTLWAGEPLLAYVFTAAGYTGRGLARRLIETAGDTLARRGHVRMNLAVTDANVRARRLYESMGFAEVPEGGERAAGG